MRRNRPRAAVLADQRGDAALQAEQILRLAARADAKVLIEIAADQEEEQQRRPRRRNRPDRCRAWSGRGSSPVARMMASEIGTSMLSRRPFKRGKRRGDRRAARHRRRSAARSAPTASRTASTRLGSMSPARPDHTETESSMMFMAAKPATATRRKQSSVSRCVSASCFAACIGAAAKPAWSSAAITSTSPARAASQATLTRFAARFARALLDAGHAHRGALDRADAAAAAHVLDGKRERCSSLRRARLGLRAGTSRGARGSVMAPPERTGAASAGRSDRRRATARRSEAEPPIGPARASARRHRRPASISSELGGEVLAVGRRAADRGVKMQARDRLAALVAQREAQAGRTCAS